MKFYIGAGMKNSKLVNYHAEALIDSSWQQTYNWTENINNDESIKDMQLNIKILNFCKGSLQNYHEIIIKF